MKRHAKEVRQYMTHLPVEVERCETAQETFDVMETHGVHHIPVMSGSHLHGILSRDNLLEAQLRLGDQFAGTSIASLCTSDPLVVSPIEPIDAVVRKMQRRKTDCALVMDGGFVVGVFTTTDVMRFVADFFGSG